MVKEVRCPNCQKKLAEADGIVIIKCPRCKKMVAVDTHYIQK